MGETINIQTLLPVGEKLKSLLNKSCINESDMKEILSSRGVFAAQNNKKVIIPFLTLSILSPGEFEKIQDLQKTKEDSMKIHTSKVSSITDNNLNEIIPLDMMKSEELVEAFDNFSFNTDLCFFMDGDNKLILEYEILRQDITKDWANCESKYIGRVEILKDKITKQIILKNEFTSAETDLVNQKVIQKLTNHLKLSGEISIDEKVFEISSDLFSNEERFTFMLQLANDSPNNFLKFQAVKNFEIGPDKTFEMPNDVKWMEGSVRNIIINSEKGETLQNVEFISNPVYHEVLILREIQAQYSFEIGGMKGRCIIEYGFPHYFRKYARTKLFEASIAKIYFSKDSKGTNYRIASRNILDEFQKLYQQRYDEILGNT